MFQVIAAKFAGDQRRTVYRTPDEENASCWAESYFQREHAAYVAAISPLGRLLRDRNGRDYVWQRVA